MVCVPPSSNTQMKDSLLKRLESLLLFRGLPPHTLKQLIRQAHERRYSKGKVIFLQGDEVHFFYLVLEGWVKLFRETPDGMEVVIDVLSANHFLDEKAVFSRGRYSWGAQVAEDTRLLAWPTRVMQEYLVKHPKLALNMLRVMSFYREQRDREIECLKTKTAPQRIGCFLLWLASSHLHDYLHKKAISIHLPYDKTLLARRLGMKSETLSRALNLLRQETGTQITGSAASIDNMSLLAAYCYGSPASNFTLGRTDLVYV